MSLPWMPPYRTPVACTQLEPELSWWLTLLQTHAVGRYLEIGSYQGGSLYHIIRTLPPGSVITSVSIGATRWKHQWQDWADIHGQYLHVLDADSTSPEAAAFLAPLAPFDAVFIDGCHWEPYVRADWSTAQRVSATPGLIGFHDITPHDAMPHERVDVDRVWQEITAAGHRTETHIAAPHTCCGIGVVMWDGHARS